MMIIDRFEGEYAVIENGEQRINVHISQLPENAKEGDVLIRDGENFYIDEQATKQRRARILEKLKKLQF